MGGSGCFAEFPAAATAKLDTPGRGPYFPPQFPRRGPGPRRFVSGKPPVRAMKIRNSLRSLRGRHRGNRLVRRKGRVFVINKTNRRFKARQG